MSPYLQLREYTPDDYRMVSGWWADHYGNDFRPGFVPRAAFIVEADGVATAFFGMCQMAPDFCYLAFPLVNPKSDKESREKSLAYLIESSKLWAVSAGIPIIYISTHGEKFLNRLREAGFVADDSTNTHLFCKVGEIE